ncbi:MAG: methyltransferase domain-containing protein, partial [Lentisphaerota bacterium]
GRFVGYVQFLHQSGALFVFPGITRLVRMQLPCETVVNALVQNSRIHWFHTAPRRLRVCLARDISADTVRLLHECIDRKLRIFLVLALGIDFIQGSARALPFDDNHFDLVFTSGVLIHIHPIDLPTVMGEIHRCSRRYVWGLEYWAETMTEVNYRDHAGLLWKADYARLYRDNFSDLSLIREENLKYLDSNNRDSMFLLEKLEKTGAAG